MKQVKAAEVARVEPVQPISGTDLAAALKPLPGADNGGGGPKGVAKPGAPAHVDPAVLKALEDKFEAASSAANSATFTIRMQEGHASFMVNELVQKIKWKGLEAYGLSKATEDLRGIVGAAAKLSESGKPDEVEFTIKHDLLEVVFHFLRNYDGVGYDDAKAVTQVAEVFVKPINELNELRAAMRSAAVDWEAAKHGMTPDQFVKQFEQSQQSKN